MLIAVGNNGFDLGLGHNRANWQAQYFIVDLFCYRKTRFIPRFIGLLPVGWNGVVNNGIYPSDLQTLSEAITVCGAYDK